MVSVILHETNTYPRTCKSASHAPIHGQPQLTQTNASKGFTEVTSKRRSSTTARVAAVGATAPLTNTEVEVEARIALERRVESLERDLARAGQESRAQSGRASSLQRKLNAVTAAGLVGDRGEAGGVSRGVRPGVDTDDVLALKAKAIQLVERLRQEKTTRLVAERETQGVATKVCHEKHRKCYEISAQGRLITEKPSYLGASVIWTRLSC